MNEYINKYSGKGVLIQIPVPEFAPTFIKSINYKTALIKR